MCSFSPANRSCPKAQRHKEPIRLRLRQAQRWTFRDWKLSKKRWPNSGRSCNTCERSFFPFENNSNSRDESVEELLVACPPLPRQSVDFVHLCLPAVRWLLRTRLSRLWTARSSSRVTAAQCPRPARRSNDATALHHHPFYPGHGGDRGEVCALFDR
jgi:hypothetical protein